MKKYKNGFTLGEVLITMTIIGVIMALSIHSVKIVKNSYTSLAYFAHKNILNMVGVLYSGTMTSSETKRGDDIKDANGKVVRRGFVTEQKLGVEELLYDDENGTEKLQPMVTRCYGSKGKIVNVLKTDGEKYSSTVSCNERVTNESNQNLFCKSLVALTNNAGPTRCDSGHLPTPTTTSEPSMTIANLNEPNFTLTNGMRFYISGWAKSNNVSKDYGYRLISVDLNGKEKPNNENATPTDIVTFLVLDNGEVFPLGAAADNQTDDNGKTISYINARVKGYYFSYGSKVKNEDGTVTKTPLARTNIPTECTKQKVDKYKCNFGVINVKKSAEDKHSVVSYREAYCAAKKGTGIAYSAYCNNENLEHNSLCPPSSDAKRFDTCYIDTVKPMFRYNFT